MNSANQNNQTWINCSSNHSSPYLCETAVPTLSPYHHYPHQSTPHCFEDSMSVCSSTLTSTPELESQCIIDGLLTASDPSSAAMVVDPHLFTSDLFSKPHNTPMYFEEQLLEQQLIVPMIHLSPPSLSQKSTSTVYAQSFQHHTDGTVALPDFAPTVRATENAIYAFHPTTTPYYATPVHESSYVRTIPSPAPYTNNSYAYNAMRSSSTHMRPNACHSQEQQSQAFNHYTPTTRVNTKVATTTKTNANKARYACTEPGCNKVFPRSYNLKSHQRTHTQERPYHCQHKQCSWSFARVHDLKRHDLQHSGLKPHGCDFCSKTFARSDALKRHWKVDMQCSQALEVYKYENDGKEPISNKKRKAKILNKRN